MKKKDILRHRTKRDQSRIPYQVNVGMSFFVCKIYYYEETNFLAVGFACDVINLLQKLFTFAKKVFFTKYSFKCQNEVCANFILLLRSRMFFFNDKK